MQQVIRNFGLSIVLSVLGFGFVLIAQGANAGMVVLILAAIELAFSFDNAIINAIVLKRLSSTWRKIFLSVGIIIAIFGVRALLPLLIVSITTHLQLGQATNLALNHPADYARALVAARPAISAFGGAFLFMLTLQFFLAAREVYWLKHIEVPLSRFEYWWLPTMLTVVIVGTISLVPLNHHRSAALTAGLAGVVVYLMMQGLIFMLNHLFASDTNVNTPQVGWAAFATFVYLEVLDASLSFDGVIGAFAITSNVLLIAVGLGIGAIWVRSLTVYLVEHKTLDTYKYLEHGAHYAIAVLAVTMLLSNIIEVPALIAGVLSLGLIGAAIVTSLQAAEHSLQ